MAQIIKTVSNNGIILTIKELAAIGLHPGHKVVSEKFETKITDHQREILFCYYRYCIDHGLKECGHYSVDGVHEDVKAWCNEVHPGDFGGNVSIKRMKKPVFELFWKTVDLEYMQELAHIDTSIFWADYQQWKDSGTEVEFKVWKGVRT